MDCGCGDKIKIRVGNCLTENQVDRPPEPTPCTDPCNKPTSPTLDCPLGGTPRFENYDYISGTLFYSPICGQTVNISICGNNAQKYIVGQRVTLMLNNSPLGSYKIASISPEGMITLLNTGAAPSDQSFPHNGTLKIISGNHDGHWNDSECKDRPEVNTGSIVLTNIRTSSEDCCTQSELACKCEGQMAPGVGSLTGYQDGDTIRYFWNDDLADRALCNNTMPQAQQASAIFGQSADPDNPTCGVKLTPPEPNLILQSGPDGQVQFLPLNACAVPGAANFDASTDEVIFCRNGQTVKARLGASVANFAENKEINRPSTSVSRELQEDAEMIHFKNGETYKGQLGGILWAGLTAERLGLSSAPGLSIISSLRYIDSTPGLYTFSVAPFTNVTDYIVTASEEYVAENPINSLYKETVTVLGIHSIASGQIQVRFSQPHNTVRDPSPTLTRVNIAIFRI